MAVTVPWKRWARMSKRVATAPECSIGWIVRSTSLWRRSVGWSKPTGRRPVLITIRRTGPRRAPDESELVAAACLDHLRGHPTALV